MTSSSSVIRHLDNELIYQILLVEDNLAHAELISRSFEIHPHFQLITVHTMSDARLSLKHSSPDLIITDYRLPDGNGTELILQFKKIADTPVILMTSFGDETVAVSAMKAGASDYIVKSDSTLNQLPVIAKRILREWRLILDKKVALDQQSRLTAIMDATPDLICMADIDGFLTYMNRAGRKMLGLQSAEDISRIRLSDFHSAEDTVIINSIGIPHAIKKGMWTHETTFKSKDNELVLTSQVLITHTSSNGEIEFFSTVARDIRDIRSAEDRIEYLAFYDTLTNLPNRNELLKQLDIEIARVQRQHTQSALLFIDLDNFKNVNDSLGHPTGDKVLKEMADRLKSTIRADDILARLGGDEFVLILSNLSTDSMSALKQARDISKKLNHYIAKDLKVESMTFNITASIGISLFSGETGNAHEILRFADTAMYEAKKSGKNNYEVFHHDMGQNVSRLLKMEQKLRKACSNGEFIMYYQPKNCAQSGRIHGAEALLRWNDPEEGILAPGAFLDILESTGLISEVDQWVIEASFKQLASWIKDGLWDDKHRLSINISAHQFKDKNFTQNVIRLLEKTAVPAQCIDLEVTEHSLINDVKNAVVRMNELNDIGITFSLDDFGTGYSSLGYLKSLPVSTLKIDKSFIRDIASDKSDEALVMSIIAISRTLGLSVVAEGIETEKQMTMLKQFDCDYLQGYFFSKPVPSEKFANLLREQII